MTQASSDVGYATCFSVGETPDGAGVWMTAGHNFRDARTGRLETQSGETYAIRNIRVSATADVAIFEASYAPKSRQLGSAVLDSKARVPGYGPLYAGGERSTLVGTIIDKDRLVGDNGEHVIEGDSGAPVLQGDAVVGVAVAYKTPALRRSDYADQNLWTHFTPSTECRKLLVQYYSGGQCGPRGCPIWTPRGYVQPYVIQQLPTPVRPAPASEGPVLDYEKRFRDLEKRLLEMETRPTEVVLSRGRTLIDREVYPAGKPIVLNLESLK